MNWSTRRHIADVNAVSFPFIFLVPEMEEGMKDNCGDVYVAEPFLPSFFFAYATVTPIRKPPSPITHLLHTVPGTGQADNE